MAPGSSQGALDGPQQAKEVRKPQATKRLQLSAPGDPGAPCWRSIPHPQSQGELEQKSSSTPSQANAGWETWNSFLGTKGTWPVPALSCVGHPPEIAWCSTLQTSSQLLQLLSSEEKASSPLPPAGVRLTKEAIKPPSAILCSSRGAGAEGHRRWRAQRAVTGASVPRAHLQVRAGLRTPARQARGQQHRAQELLC